VLIEEIDRDVGPRDVGLLVGLHLASPAHARPPAAPDPFAELLARELDAFAEAAAGVGTPIGAEPLDPDSFLSG
jgi:hypothetical protein